VDRLLALFFPREALKHIQFLDRRNQGYGLRLVQILELVRQNRAEYTHRQINIKKADSLGLLGAEYDKAVDEWMFFITEERSYFFEAEAVGIRFDGGETTHIGRQYFPNFRHIFRQKIQIDFEYPAHHMA
jgi:hypothetical protein